MVNYNSPAPFPNPTPYQSPSQGGNKYVTPGTIGIAIPQSSTPLIGPTQSGGVNWSTGQTTPRTTVNTASLPAGQDNRIKPQQQQQTQQNPAPTSNQNQSGFDRTKFQGNNIAGMFWDPAEGYKQINGGGGEADMSQMISELYDPALRLANEQEQNVRTGYNQDLTNLNNRFGESQAQYNQQGEQLLGDADLEQSRFNQTLESALQQAVRAYNALSQRGSVQYGGASSTGRALGELASREFYRQQGAVQTKQAQGNQDFGIERGKIKQYTDSKLKDLDLYKQEAITSLERNLSAQLETIAARKYDIEANRTRDKMAALQNTINQTKAVAEQDKQFRQNLAIASLNQLQEISGRAFTPAEIKAYVNEFSSNVNISGADNGGQASALSQLATKPKAYKDEFQSLNINSAPQNNQQQNTGSYLASVPNSFSSDYTG